MPAHPTSADWERLGRMLEQRRVDIDTRYANRTLFADERGIDARLAYDVEKGARTNYRRPTRRAIEVAYGLPPGAIQHALAGGDFSPARRQEDDSLADLIRRIDPDQPMTEDQRDALKKALRPIIEAGAEHRANWGQERRRA